MTEARRRLALVCGLSTGIILVAMVLACLIFAQRQLSQSSTTAFQSDVNAVLFHLRSQTIVDHTWISQTETAGDLIVSLELLGRPLLYRGAGDTEQRAALVEAAKEKALQEYHFDLSQRPSGTFQPNQVNFHFKDKTGQEYRAATAVLPLEKGWVGLVILRSTEVEEGLLFRQRLAFGGFTLLALGMLALFALHFSRWVLRPLEESRRRQTEFVHATSHELRSPLAVIHTSLSALKGATPEKASHFTEMALSECLRMSRLVSDMLTLASADDGTWSVLQEEAEPETLLLGVYEGFECVARDKGIRITVSLPESPLPRCKWDRQRVSQMLSILVENGLDYTPSGGTLSMGVLLRPEGVRLTIADTGPGIPPEQKEKIFERFYRGDDSRTSREHYGLGLCIAKEIAILHHGSLRVEDTPGGGATFVLTLPVE